MGFLDQVYRDAVLEHARSPRNRGELDPYSVRQEGVNPSCGDELVLYLRVEGGEVAGASFTGHGCAISQASASLMTQAVRGLRVDEAKLLVERFKDMVHGRGAHPSLGDAAVLEGVSKLHARVKCATLAWIALDAGLDAEAAGKAEAEQISVDQE